MARRRDCAGSPRRGPSPHVLKSWASPVSNSGIPAAPPGTDLYGRSVVSPIEHRKTSHDRSEERTVTGPGRHIRKIWDNLNPREPTVAYLAKMFVFAASLFLIAFLIGRFL